VKVDFKESFLRDAKKIRDKTLLAQIKTVIEQVEQAATLQDVGRLKRLSGSSSSYYRIRVGDYRIGLSVESDVVIFVWCLNRKEIYRYFP
jgi:mRNA interferase RelE/StbE